ncbi:hypothetical protein D9M68_989060 [compost metagenome]
MQRKNSMNNWAGQRRKNQRLIVSRHRPKPSTRPMRLETSASSRVTFRPSQRTPKFPLRKWKSNW